MAAPLVIALPGTPYRNTTDNPDHNIKPYMAPGPDDSRGPCPMLNSLANHGYINHDGRNIKKQDLINALFMHVGIMESAVETAMLNAFTLCAFTTGSDCGTTLANLTLLALPHAFEHEHSFSREDYKMKYIAGPDDHSDNANFNQTIFDDSLAVLQNSSHMTIQQMNQVRLQRESLSLQQTWPGWFEESRPIQEFESGFIFAVMGDFHLPNFQKEPMVRVEWWKYWFENEALPYELGWHRPEPRKDVNYVLSVSSRVLAASLTSTPSPIPSGALHADLAPALLPADVATTTYELPHYTPYIGTIGKPAKRAEATAAPTPAMAFKNPYVHTLDMDDIARQQQMANDRVAVMMVKA